MRVFCKFADDQLVCNHPRNRRLFGMLRRPCNWPNDESRCRYWVAPNRSAPLIKEPLMHGQCVDTAGNEWEILAVTESDVVILVRSPDGHSSQTHLPKGPFLGRLLEAEIATGRLE